MKRFGRPFWCQWRTLVWLTVIWVMLWGNLAPATVLSGALIAIAVVVILPLPPMDLRGTVRPAALCILVGHLVADLVIASCQVGWLAIHPTRTPRGAVVGVQLRSTSDVFLTITCELSCLVPGSIVVEVHRQTRMIYLHVLDIDQAGGPDAVRADARALEARVMRTFATSEALAEWGVPRPGALRLAATGERSEP